MYWSRALCLHQSRATQRSGAKPYCGVMKQADMPSCLEGGEFWIKRDQGIWVFNQKARNFCEVFLALVSTNSSVEVRILPLQLSIRSKKQ